MSDPFSVETLTLMRRMRVANHHKPKVYRELLLVDQLMHHYRSNATDTTGIGVPYHLTAGSVLTAEEVGAVLDVKPDTVRRALREGRLQGEKDPTRHRAWRVTPAAVAEYRSR